MSRTFCLKVLVVVIVLILLCPKPEAALLPEDARKMEGAFLKTADIEAVISLIKIDNEIFCGIKSAFKAACQCTAVYQIQETFRKPESLILSPGDYLLLNYPCDKTGGMNWTGSTVPWARPQKDGLLLMTIPSGYLKPLGANRWILDNQGNIFGPIKPTLTQDET
ncbi:MAG TPA: hypothetical protein DE315_04310 [Candidatus Omnitrophica bacterium]|nr:hypothetical protein [Candidatus Omnitrophota bacterium]HCI44738.1 hypothetical protein [Candidatus Omnitrophota bacterium]